MRALRLLLLLPLLALLGAPPLPAAERVLAGLSHDRVAITANFDGSEITIFGAVKREVPVPDTSTLEVIVTVTGPEGPVTVRRKSRMLGIWVNAEAVEIDAAPSFYAVSTTGPLDLILSEAEDLTHRISIGQMIHAVGVPPAIADSGRFPEALVRLRTRAGLYATDIGGVTLSEDTLFQTGITLPANLVEGAYSVRIFLTRDQQVIDSFQMPIYVQKVGLERWMFVLAHQQPLVYGILSVLIAVLAGWAASAVFRLVR
jgi:uncharacterized protein (TIGR02186 family)